MNFLRFVVLPIGFFGVLVAALILGMWTIAAISGILLTYFLVLVRREYTGERPREERRLDQLIDAWRDPSAFGLLASGAVIVIAASSFGLTIGVAVGIGIWFVLLALWLRARFKHRTRNHE